MSWLAQAIVTGISAFVATNLDDILILMFLFSQVNPSFRIRHIVMGQYLGFSALIVASLPGFFGGLIIPKTWIGLLGFLPIAIGISQLVQREEEETSFKTVANDVRMRSPLLLAPPTYSVTAITFANGGDNIGIYVPLFANSSVPEFAVILGVFFLLVGIWCCVAYQLSRQPLIGRLLNRHGKHLVPFVLMGLGIFILMDSKTYQLLPFFRGS
jgi:cadmium resistance transport/sequestration family protein